MPSKDQIVIQTAAAYKQWAPQWREQAKEHAKFKMKSLIDFENIGIGKSVLCIANGYTFEENLETIKANQGTCDILVCDKTLGHCLDNGIKPTYCLVCDANVDFDKYLAKYKDQVQDIILFINVCANPRWSTEAKWKDMYFFVNKDVAQHELEFMKLSGCPNAIPAATNVSNAMVVLLTQSDNSGRNNFFGYDKILLIGYDYSWRLNGKYYAFDETGAGKTNYMRHLFIENANGTMAYSSGNLAFSAEWLQQYVRTFQLPVYQCTKETIAPTPMDGELARDMRYEFRSSDSGRVRGMLEERNNLAKKVKDIERELRKIGREHQFNIMATL
jgi:hypothetical protein